jgi:hypothetical protein
MAKMYMEKAHREGYEGPTAPFHRSRWEVWIIGERQLTKAI